MTTFPSSASGLQLLLLGDFEARLNGHSVTSLSYLTMRALLVYLAVEREQDHKREVLAELLWPDCDCARARGNLRRTLADLRKALELPSGDAMFAASKVSLRFVATGYVDVLDFAAQTPYLPKSPLGAQHEERLIGLYRGKFLTELSVPDCPGFQEWLQQRREALHRRALMLLEALSNRYEQQGNYRKALQFALRHAELEPGDESMQRQTMRLYALSGQSAAALRHHEVCCSQRKTQTGALPDARTQQLAAQIRCGTWRADLPHGSPVNVQHGPDSQAVQRRQVTVLCCELSLAGMDDPDELMDALSAPQARVVDIIRQFSGHVVQTHGGGLQAYFGFPQASEDAARQAVQAALAVMDEASPGVEMRVGIHTGPVVTGGTWAMPDTSGQTTRVAMGLRQHAPANGVLISQNTHNMVAGNFSPAQTRVQCGMTHFPFSKYAMDCVA